ncbi:MAG: HNH endonuclease signature motif containing protein [Candidatus Bathyarchaeia archaeon]
MRASGSLHDRSFRRDNAAILFMGSFPDSLIAQAWRRAEACCECRRITHKHRVPCGMRLTWENRGREGRGAWEAHHIVGQNAGGADILSNCEILCWNCHSNTF